MEQSVFSERTEESSAVQYFQVRRLTVESFPQGERNGATVQCILIVAQFFKCLNCYNRLILQIILFVVYIFLAQERYITM